MAVVSTSKSQVRASEHKLYQKYKISARTASVWQLRAWRLNKIETFNLIRKKENSLKNKLVLNVGCGRDILFEYFKKEGATLFEYDLVADALLEIKDEGAENLITGDVFHLPFKGQVFNIVFCIGLLHHLHPLKFPLFEMVRVLKRGGTIYCVEPNKDYFLSMLIDFVGHTFRVKFRENVLPRLFRNYVAPAHYECTLPSREIKGLLEKLGVRQLVEIFNIDPHFVLPKVFAIFQCMILNKMLSKMPSPILKHFAFEFTVLGKR